MGMLELELESGTDVLLLETGDSLLLETLPIAVWDFFTWA